MSAPPPAAADAAAAPLHPAELAARLDRLGPFEQAPELAVAVSGGSDSLALALLARDWAARRGGRAIGLIVDHGLRPESGHEAALAAGWLAARAMPAAVLAWTGPKPATGIQAAARTARYALLEAACRERAILHLLLAQHADDQAETVAMRAERHSGEAGLAGMAAVVERPGLRLLRPLLDLPKARLAATLRAMGQPWIDDPGNLAPRFHRGRLRSDEGFDRAAWWQRGAALATQRTARDGELAAFLARHAGISELGQVALRRAGLDGLAPALRELALRRVLHTVSGRAYAAGRLPPVPAAGCVTCGGCILEGRGAWLRVAREPGRISHRLRLRPGDAPLWDGRFLVRYQGGPSALTLGLLGEQGRARLPDELRHRLRDAGISTFAIAALPALYHEDVLVACPPLLAARAPCRVAGELHPRVALCAAAFCGANVVSNHQRPIYRVSLGERAVSGTPGFVPR